jgi:hypothetical protein
MKQIFNPEVGDSSTFRNVGKHMPDNMARHIAEDSTVSILHKYR